METRMYFPLELTCGKSLVLFELIGAEYVGTGVSSTISIEMPGGVFVGTLVGVFVLIGVLVKVGKADAV